MIYIVSKITLEPRGQLDNAGQRLQMHSKDHIKEYCSTEQAAVLEAERLATLNPGEMFGVFTAKLIVETKAPVFRRKVVNDSGEIVISPEEA